MPKKFKQPQKTNHLARDGKAQLAPLSKGGRGDFLLVEGGGQKGFVKLIILLIVALAFGGLILYEYKKPAYEGSEGQINHQENDIQVIEVADGKIVKNIKEGIEIKVPKDWEVGKTPLQNNEKINIFKLGPQQLPDTEMLNGTKLQISTENNLDDLSIQQWAKIYWKYSGDDLNKLKLLDINNIQIIKTMEAVQNDQDDPWSNITTNMIHFAFTKNKKYYDFYCEIISQVSESQKYTQECENLIKENIENFNQ